MEWIAESIGQDNHGEAVLGDSGVMGGVSADQVDRGDKDIIS